MKVLIYPGPLGNVAVAALNPKHTDLVAAGKKFVPKGLPFKIINDSELPKDDTFFDAWEYDFTNKDGVGERE